MAQTTILEEQTLEGFVDGVLEELTVSASVVVTAGQTYTVAWDGTEYTCEAFQLPAGDMIFTCLGKGTMFGVETGEYPFVLVYASAEITGGDPVIQVICEDTESTTHTLAIYQGEAVGVILKDRDGEDRTYYGVEAVKLVTTDGGTQLFSKGEAAENVRIVPDFSGGDMTVQAAQGTLIKSAVVVKPETLVPENIAQGVNIAGIVGKLQVGGTAGSGKYLVRVIDYDGTVLKEAWMNTGDVFTLPDPPEHDRLVFDGWSASAEIVDGTFTVTNNHIAAGATYHTASGATEIDLVLTTDKDLTFTFADVLTGLTGVDWGDGTVNTELTHTYGAAGAYTVKLYGLTGTTIGCIVKDVEVNKAAVKAVFLSAEVTSLGTSAFSTLGRMGALTLPVGLTAAPQAMCYMCYGLRGIVLPSTVTSVGYECFKQTYGLENAVIPRGVTTFSSYAFHANYSLQYFPLPDSLVTLGSYAIRTAYTLRQIIIPAGVTAITTELLYYSFNVRKVTFLGNVTSLAANCLGLFYNLEECDFSNCTAVPTLSATTAFNSWPSSARIFVPADLLEEWKAASNWSNYADQLVGV